MQWKPTVTNFGTKLMKTIPTTIPGFQRLGEGKYHWGYVYILFEFLPSIGMFISVGITNWSYSVQLHFEEPFSDCLTCFLKPIVFQTIQCHHSFSSGVHQSVGEGHKSMNTLLNHYWSLYPLCIFSLCSTIMSLSFFLSLSFPNSCTLIPEQLHNSNI